MVTDIDDCRVYLLFPWWDSFTLIDVWGNYVWTAALIVLFLYRMREATDKAGVWWCLLAFAAGMSHEAASAPIDRKSVV